MQKRTAVLVSGRGSNLKALIEYKPSLEVVLVIADCDCAALTIAKEAGIAYFCNPSFTPGWNREEFTRDILDRLLNWEIEFVVMAGYMTLLHLVAFDYFDRRILNIHPSLLPKFKGRYAVRDTLAAKEKWTGSTVQIASAQMDSGITLAQSREPVYEDDTEETLHKRLKVKEQLLYPWAVEQYYRSLPNIDARL